MDYLQPPVETDGPREPRLDGPFNIRPHDESKVAANALANIFSLTESSLPSPLTPPSKPKTRKAKSSKLSVPKFLSLLYQILQTENANYIRWSPDGLAVQIPDTEKVATHILPKYFNHTNFHSFQRQLNYFGFRKWTKSKAEICTFSHPCFQRDEPSLLRKIKRKKAHRKPLQDTSASKGYNEESGALSFILPHVPNGKRSRSTNDDSRQMEPMHLLHADHSGDPGLSDGVGSTSAERRGSDSSSSSHAGAKYQRIAPILASDTSRPTDDPVDLLLHIRQSHDPSSDASSGSLDPGLNNADHLQDYIEHHKAYSSGLETQLRSVRDENARLKAQVERLLHQRDVLAQENAVLSKKL